MSDGSPLEDLRARVREALGARRIWYHGFRAHRGGTHPRGGEVVIARHNRILRSAGVESHIVRADGPITRRNPFAGRGDDAERAPEAWFRRELDPDRDIVLIPGYRINELRESPVRLRVLFAHGAFVPALACSQESSAWPTEAVLAVMTVSEASATLLQLMSPGSPVIAVRLSVDPDRFAPAEKQRLVLCPSPSGGCEKNPYDLALLQQILTARSGRDTNPFTVRVLGGLTDDELSDSIARARVLLFPSTHEGFGLLPVQAMLARTLPFGYGRPPMTEYLPARCQFAWGDLVGIADAVIDALDHPENWTAVTEEGRRTALAYTPVAAERSVLEAWVEVARLAEAR